MTGILSSSSSGSAGELDASFMQRQGAPIPSPSLPYISPSEKSSTTPWTPGPRESYLQFPYSQNAYFIAPNSWQHIPPGTPIFTVPVSSVIYPPIITNRNSLPSYPHFSNEYEKNRGIPGKRRNDTEGKDESCFGQEHHDQVCARRGCTLRVMSKYRTPRCTEHSRCLVSGCRENLFISNEKVMSKCLKHHYKSHEAVKIYRKRKRRESETTHEGGRKKPKKTIEVSQDVLISIRK